MKDNFADRIISECKKSKGVKEVSDGVDA